MRCKNCGSENDDNLYICQNCGSPLYDEDDENEAIKVDGTLLKQIGEDRLKYQVSFDLIIELENNVKLKTKINLNLPAGNILENGIETIEETNMKTVFKRI